MPFLKVDKGLADEADGAQVMKAMPDLDAVLARAIHGHGVFGTKMRSVIKLAHVRRDAVVGQQFEVGRRDPCRPASCRSWSPTSTAPRRKRLRSCSRPPCSPGWELGAVQYVMLKLTLPEQDGFYAELVVRRAARASGGYTRAGQRAPATPGVVASFSRALTEGLTAQKSPAVRRSADASIESICQASITWKGPARRIGSPSSNCSAAGTRRITVIRSSA